jgi:transposase
MRPLVTDELWGHVQLLLPPPQRRFRFPGRKPLDYRNILTGILFVLKTGIAWDDLPAELGCGCGKICRHYLRLWHQAGVGSVCTPCCWPNSTAPIKSTGSER